MIWAPFMGGDASGAEEGGRDAVTDQDRGSRPGIHVDQFHSRKLHKTADSVIDTVI
jgi:hypothetical protein